MRVMLRRLGGQSGMTLIEVMLAVTFLAVSLVALLSMLAQGSVSVGVGGSQSKATAFARQRMEQLRNQPFVPGPVNGADAPEPGITRSWSIAPTGPSVPPNRLATIQVIVRVDRATGTLGAQNITLTTMRAE
jgi:type II secretory pathway pseudopilin PulG